MYNGSAGSTFTEQLELVDALRVVHYANATWALRRHSALVTSVFIPQLVKANNKATSNS